MTTKSPKTRVNDISYFDWLYGQIEIRDFSGLEDFIFDLHSFPFVCRQPNDDNRVEDGLALRNRFAEIKNNDFKDARPCSILEMLIALAIRMDFILYDSRKGDQYPKWFWLFVNNLRLQKYRPDDEKVVQKKRYNRLILKKFVNREYQEDGKGGLFPLKNSKYDQRTREIWYQMMDYISENYDI